MSSVKKHEKQDYSALLDASGGTGKNTTIDVFDSQYKVGYAGDISPENVENKLSVLLESPYVDKFWIDMESGVRTDDLFALDKVEDVLKKCYKLLNY